MNRIYKFDRPIRRVCRITTELAESLYLICQNAQKNHGKFIVLTEFLCRFAKMLE